MTKRHDSYFDGDIPGLDVLEGRNYNAAAVAAGLAAIAVFTGVGLGVKASKSREAAAVADVPHSLFYRPDLSLKRKHGLAHMAAYILIHPASPLSEARKHITENRDSLRYGRWALRTLAEEHYVLVDTTDEGSEPILRPNNLLIDTLKEPGFVLVIEDEVRAQGRIPTDVYNLLTHR